MSGDTTEVTPRRKTWRRWLTSGIGLLVIAGIFLIIGIWNDSRWAATAAIFLVPGMVITIIAANALNNLSRPARRGY